MGTALLADPVAMWRAIAANLDEGDPFTGMVGELIAHVLVQGPAVGTALADAVAPILLEQSWMERGVPLTLDLARECIHVPLYHWRVFGLLDETYQRFDGVRFTGEASTSLTAAGRATAMAVLHARATRPRKSVFG